MTVAALQIRECITLSELEECVRLQREVFDLPDAELSPVRHLIVTRNAGGFTLGAYDGERLAGFVLSVPAFMYGEKAFYSHMTGVRAEYQSHGVGSQLKWAQRERALSEGIRYIKWTFEPIKARNAYFNLNKLGAVVADIEVNFYGADNITAARSDDPIELAGDRLFAEWHLENEKVKALAAGKVWTDTEQPLAEITVTNDWAALVKRDPHSALKEQLRLRDEFQRAFAAGMRAESFRPDDIAPAYRLYQRK